MGQIGYIFNVIFSFPILNVLVLFFHLFGDLALSIIVMTIVIKLILFPLTVKQLKSMKATQALQPQMAEIKKKYAKDQQAQAVAMQALYKEYGINPLSGCLPLLIQLPVLYGLYNALNIVVRGPLSTLNGSLYGFVAKFPAPPNADFNWFTWINSSWHFSLANPDPTHILPVLAALATFVQLRMSQANQKKNTSTSKTDGKADPTAQSMKWMAYIMPLFTLFIGLSFPAGLALYWTVSSVFQAVQQFLISGWGGLLPASFTNRNSDNNRNSNNKSTKNLIVSGERRGEILPAIGEPAIEGNGSGAIASHLHTTPRANGSSSTPSARRRQRSTSASARRRGSTQRSR